MGYHSHAGPSRMNKPAGAASGATSATTSGASAPHQAAEDDFKVTSMWAVSIGGHLSFAGRGLKPALTGERCCVCVTAAMQLSQQ